MQNVKEYPARKSADKKLGECRNSVAKYLKKKLAHKITWRKSYK